MDISLVIFCKRPKLGQGKQRLAAGIGKEAALQVAEVLLECVLEDAAQWPGPVVLSPASEADRGWAEQLAGGTYQVIPQSEGNLGERIVTLDASLREQGQTKIIYIGSDAPEHHADLYAQMRAALSDADVMLTPASDGGVTAMGSVCGWGALGLLPWSTPQLGVELEQQCLQAGRQVLQTCGCSDVDQQEDLQRLLNTLRQDNRPARQKLLRVIRQLLEEPV